MAWLWLVPALLVLLSCLPLRLDLEVTSSPRFRGAVRVTWAGVVRGRVELGSATNRDAPPRDTSASPRPKPRTSKGSVPPLSALLPAARHTASLVRALLAQTKVRNLTVQARAGLDDPADTGMLWGALAPLLSWAGDHPAWFDLAPVFGGSCLELRGSARLTLVPARYLLVLTQFALNPRTWRLGYALRPR